MNRAASSGLLLLGIAAMGWVGLLWYERAADNKAGNSEYAIFSSELDVDELKQFDLFFEQYRTKVFTIPDAHASMEWIDMKRDHLQKQTFKDSYENSVGGALWESYTSLYEAYQAKLDAMTKIGSNRAIAMASDVAKAKTKYNTSGVNYLATLLIYEKVLERNKTVNREVEALIAKYRNITGQEFVLTEN